MKTGEFLEDALRMKKEQKIDFIRQRFQRAHAKNPHDIPQSATNRN